MADEVKVDEKRNVHADKWLAVRDVKCDLSVDLPFPGFRVSDLVQLSSRAVIDTHWPVGNGVPLRVNGELLAWCEFEVVEERLAVRLMELA